MKISYFLPIVGLLSTSLIAASSTCHTYEVCLVDQECTCQVAPSSAYDRYFYFQFRPIKQLKEYICQFENKIHYPVDYNNSYFPEGVYYVCLEGDCQHFPFKLYVNTTQMTATKDVINLRYLVPGSDITFPSTVSCKTISYP